MRPIILLRRAAAALAVATLAACEENVSPGSRQSNAIWLRDFAPAPRATILGGGIGAVGIVTGDSLLLLDNAIGSRLWGVAWRDTLGNGAIGEQVVVAPTRTGAAGFARADGRLLFRDSADAGANAATVAVALRDTVAVLLREDGALRALVARTGRELWRTPPRCVTARCAGHELVTVAGGVVVASGRRLDGSGSFLIAHRLATGAAVETGLPTSPTFVANITAAADSDLVVMDQTGDALLTTDGVGTTLRWEADLRLSQSPAAPPLIGEPSPFAQGQTVLAQNRATGSPIASAFDRRTGAVRWQVVGMIPLGICGTRYLTATADGYVLTDAATGRPTIRIQRFRTAADSVASGTPVRPITAGLIVIAYDSPTAIRVHAC